MIFMIDKTTKTSGVKPINPSISCLIQTKHNPTLVVLRTTIEKEIIIYYLRLRLHRTVTDVDLPFSLI
jgi:hypothetical protein